MHNPAAARRFRHLTSLSGNEIYCLRKMSLDAGQICLGNSVLALGIGGGLSAGMRTLSGGEVEQVTKLVHEGRQKSFERMMAEAKEHGGLGVTGVTFDIVNHGGNLEFLTTGSTVHAPTAKESLQFSTSADAQELYCQVDAGFEPVQFVFGNVAYSIGLGGNISGAFRQLKRGEVPQYTEIFDHTRHLALERITAQARACGANSVIGIRTVISPMLGTQEMMMVGTASKHPSLGAHASQPVTSDMTNEEMWNMAHLGYLPVRLVMGVSVYSLGFTAGLNALFQSLGGGEVSDITAILYEAREQALDRIDAEARKFGADEVIGVKTRVYDLGGGLVEFMAIGTAVKKFEGVKTRGADLPPQAIIVDEDTFVDTTYGRVEETVRSRASSASRTQSGPVMIVVIVIMALFYGAMFLIGLRH